jgi:hypothetical protein
MDAPGTRELWTRRNIVVAASFDATPDDAICSGTSFICEPASRLNYGCTRSVVREFIDKFTDEFTAKLRCELIGELAREFTRGIPRTVAPQLTSNNAALVVVQGT